jgi:hypothetical protein
MKKKIAVLFLIFSMVFISCDQDFNTIGSDLVGDEHFDFDTYDVSLKAYSVRTGEVQTNNLPINPLGFYDNPYFGETNANFVTDLALNSVQPNFGTAVQVDDVTLYIPFYSKVKTTNEDGSREFTLDSIYSKTEAGKTSKMKLNVYENGYYLSPFEGPNQDATAKYYSDMNAVIDAQKRGADGSGNSISGGTRLNNSSNLAENDEFFFNKSEIVIYKTKLNTVSGNIEFVDENDAFTTDPSKYVVKERLAPGIYLHLNKDFFKKKIIESASDNLFNNNNFRQYFKGLYFKMEQIAGEEGAMAMLNFNVAKLNIDYHSIDAGSTIPTVKTFLIGMGLNSGGNTVSLQDFAYSGDYDAGLTASNLVTGQDANLFIKGGKGSVVYMDVFGDTDVKGIVNGVFVPGANQVPDELEELRLKGWLINDAYLEFYIDKTKMAGNTKFQEAERLYLFDATNQKPLADYLLDSSTSSNSKQNKLIHGGTIVRDDTGSKKGVKYKIRITQHINNLINSSNVNINKNVKLGLCVTENIGLTGNYFYKSPITFSSGPDINFFPVTSIFAQQGTVLHGTGSTASYIDPSTGEVISQKLKLTIHYTKPN